MNILIFLDGVLRREKDRSPIQEGVSMYKSLIERSRVVVIADDKVEAERWFKENGMSQKLDDIVDIAPKGELDLKFRRVDHCRSNGKVDFVVTDDPDLSKKLLEAGISTYLLLSPRYIRPEFRPDGRGRMSWDDIIEELDRQQELYKEDPRL